jgi:hypothetical protein
LHIAIHHHHHHFLQSTFGRLRHQIQLLRKLYFSTTTTSTGRLTIQPQPHLPAASAKHIKQFWEKASCMNAASQGGTVAPSPRRAGVTCMHPRIPDTVQTILPHELGASKLPPRHPN